MRLSAGLVAALFILPAGASPSVRVSGAWARATLPGQDEGVVYMTLTAPSGDELVSVSSPEAAGAMLHRSVERGGQASMQDVDMLKLPAGVPVTLAPRGLHIMLMGLKHALEAGSRVMIELDFRAGGVLRESVPVLPIGSAGP